MPVEAKGSFDLDSVTPDELQKIVDKVGSQRAFSRKYGVARSTLQLRLHKVERQPYGHIPAPEARRIDVSGPIARFIVSSAQDGTELHRPFLTNLEAYRDYYLKDGPCQIILAGFTYNKKLFEENDPEKMPYWDPRIEQYRVQERIRLGDRIDFCGEMNTLPTAKTPLTGFETYTRHRWGIIPHAKVQLRSVPTMKNAPAKIVMTTGAVTKPNYIRRRAGIEAAFHHTLGAVLVEIAADGTFFCRHLLAEADGSFYDLDVRVQTMPTAERGVTFGSVTTGHRAKAINWGDLHVAQIDPDVARASFGFYPTEEKDGGLRLWRRTYGPDSILDALKPEFQFFHDVADFQSRNHHNLRDPHHMYALFCEGVDSVEDELREVAAFIDTTRRDFCDTVIVESNHDLALKRWLKEADYRLDPLNAEFFLECQRQSYRAIRLKNRKFSIFEHVLTEHFGPNGIHCDGVRFLREDESFTVLDIEYGMHGHLGANGARGSPQAFTKMGPKAVTGHTHCLTAGHRANVRGRGFVKVEDIVIGDQVLGYEPITNRNVWTTVKGTPRGTYTGTLVEIGGGLFRQTVTSEHRLFLTDGTYLPLSEAIAFRAHTDVPLKALPVVDGEVTDELHEDLFLRQIVAAAADGSVQNGAIRFHLKKPRKVERLQALFGDSLTRPPAPGASGSYKATLSKMSVTNQALMRVFAEGKRLPGWLADLSLRQTKIVVDELRYWDGVYKIDGAGRQFGTSKDSEAYLVAGLCNKLGYRTTAKRKCLRDNDFHLSWDESPAGSSPVAMHDKARLAGWNVHTRAVSEEPVFCLETQHSNFWVMHPVTGQVSLTGNSCEIRDGIYTSGTSSKLDLGYNKGLSSWSQSHVLTYPNGKRVILTLNNGKWRL